MNYRVLVRSSRVLFENGAGGLFLAHGGLPSAGRHLALGSGPLRPTSRRGSIATPFADFLTGLPRRAGALAATLGAVALAGWSADIDIMRRLLPGAPLILPNTALALVLLAMSLVLLDGAPDRHRRRLAAYISAFVAVFGVVTVAQHAFGFFLPSDVWLFGDRVRAADPTLRDAPRVPPASASCCWAARNGSLRCARRDTSRLPAWERPWCS